MLKFLKNLFKVKREDEILLLSKFWESWTLSQDLPFVSADELARDELTEQQKKIVDSFIELWELVSE